MAGNTHCQPHETACPNHRNVRSKLSPILRTSTGSTSSPRTSIFPNSIIKQHVNSSSYDRLLASHQRQPSIIPTIDHIVKRVSTQFRHNPLPPSHSSRLQSKPPHASHSSLPKRAYPPAVARLAPR